MIPANSLISYSFCDPRQRIPVAMRARSPGGIHTRMQATRASGTGAARPLEAWFSMGKHNG